MGYAAGSKGCKTAALITENYGAATLTEDKTADKGFEAASKGGKVVKRIEVGTTNTTYAPQVATMIGAGAECIIAPLPPDEFPKLFASIEQSSKPNLTVGSTAASVPTEILKTLGSKADKMVIGSASYIPGSLEEPKAVTEAIAAIKKVEPSGEINTFSVAAVAAVKIVAHAIEEAGEQRNRERRPGTDGQTRKLRNGPGCSVHDHHGRSDPGPAEDPQPEHPRLRSNRRQGETVEQRVHRPQLGDRRLAVKRRGGLASSPPRHFDVRSEGQRQ